MEYCDQLRSADGRRSELLERRMQKIFLQMLNLNFEFPPLTWLHLFLPQPADHPLRLCQSSSSIAFTQRNTHRWEILGVRPKSWKKNRKHAQGFVRLQSHHSQWPIYSKNPDPSPAPCSCQKRDACLSHREKGRQSTRKIKVAVFCVETRSLSIRMLSKAISIDYYQFELLRLRRSSVHCERSRRKLDRSTRHWSINTTSSRA